MDPSFGSYPPHAGSFAKHSRSQWSCCTWLTLTDFLHSVFAHHGRYYDIMTAEKKRSIDYLSNIATLFRRIQRQLIVQ